MRHDVARDASGHFQMIVLVQSAEFLFHFQDGTIFKLNGSRVIKHAAGEGESSACRRRRRRRIISGSNVRRGVISVVVGVDIGGEKPANDAAENRRGAQRETGVVIYVTQRRVCSAFLRHHVRMQIERLDGVSISSSSSSSPSFSSSSPTLSSKSSSLSTSKMSKSVDDVVERDAVDDSVDFATHAHRSQIAS